MSDGLDNCVSELMRLADSYNRAVAERDEAIEALQRLEPYGKDAAPNELEGATALAGLDPGTYWRTRHQLLRAEIRKACAIISKHPPKVTT